MKNITFLLTISFLFKLSTLSAQDTYYDFPHIGWSQTCNLSIGDFQGNYEGSLVTNVIDRDTLLNGVQYYVLGNRLLRREGGKIYTPDFFEEESLLQDYSLNIGDTYISKVRALPSGIIIDTFTVINKYKILSPSQDSLIYMELTKNTTTNFPNLTWLEGVGEPAVGYCQSLNDKNSFTYLLCVKNSQNQTLANSIISDCNCESIYGTDNDNDGARNKTGSLIQLEITEQNADSRTFRKMNSCDTLAITSEDGFPIFIQSDDQIFEADTIYYSSTGSQDITFLFYDLSALQSFEVTIETVYTPFVFTVLDCVFEDCDDNNPNINPAQDEIPYNGIDDDCDPMTVDDDLDDDGYNLSQDCDDNNSGVNPDMEELVYNGIDDDCDPSTLDDDFDQDGFNIDLDCDDNNPNINPNAIEIAYNNIDEDCNPNTFDDDIDQDGFNIDLDCDDNNPDINPDATEIAYNNIDDDCNPDTVDDDLDQDGFNADLDCDDNNSDINPNAIEIAYNNIDEDCNPNTFDDDIDQDGFNIDLDCDDNNPDINPNAIEIANNSIDEDCDGSDLIISSTADTAKPKFIVYPNPCNSYVSIDSNIGTDFSIIITDTGGRALISTTNHTNIDVKTLRAGIYFLSIVDSSKSIISTQKLIIKSH